MSTPLEIRDKYVRRLREQLVGPAIAVDEKWPESTKPDVRYTLGILFPQEEQAEDGGGPGVGLDATEDEIGPLISDSDEGGGGVDDSPLASMLQRKPACAGLSFATTVGATIEITARGAKYEKITDDDGNHQYERRQLEDFSFSASLGSNELYKESTPGLEGKVECRIRARNIQVNSDEASAVQLVTVAIINSAMVEEGGFAKSENCIFQVELKVKCLKGNFVEPPSPKTAFDDDEEELRLRYRNQIAWATGHATSVRWSANEPCSSPSEIAIDFMPESNVYEFIADARDDSTYDTQILSIDFLSGDNYDAKGLRKLLVGFVKDFEKWCKQCENIKIEDYHAKAYERIISRLDDQVKRFYVGIDALCDTKYPERLRSFKIANLAMLNQMQQAAAVAKKDFVRADAKWRPFQLAFQLLSIPGIINEDEDSGRDIVDLIWFPTGGGKTEAYLLLMAFTIIWRREVYGKEGCGLSVFTRYTLRLLTQQQFQRNTILTCAFELLRQDNMIPGDEISIGLWIGGGSEGKRLSVRGAKELYDKMMDSGDNSPLENNFNLMNCPWCGKSIVPEYNTGSRSDVGIAINVDATTFTFNCPDSDCKFHKKLPIQVVDECLYDSPPTILLGTIDKFANLVHKGQSRSFFGITEKTRPPDLIIQDELHLISGPLGTISSIYEVAIDLLCTDAKGVSPKIVASTATIRGAENQARSLYGREVDVFPTAGPNYDDSYYMKLNNEEGAQSRKYIGIMGQGQTPTSSSIHIAAALLDTAQEIKDAGDLYWTLVAYHGSKTQLSSFDTNCRDDIPKRIEVIYSGNDWNKPPRKCDEVTELSSNVKDHEIPSTLRLMDVKRGETGAIDALPCTNMISVGVDIPRLNLMMIQNQPKTSAEYIQASSRVGRDSKLGAGVVVAAFSPLRPRDRSHYESFPIFHESIYRWVEPTSVTPHSMPALKRALHAAILMVIRLRYWPLNGNASDIDCSSDKFAEAIEAIKARFERAIVNSKDFERVSAEIDSQVDWLKNYLPAVHKYREKSSHLGLMKGFNEESTQVESQAKETMFSMRNVDSDVPARVQGQGA